MSEDLQTTLLTLFSQNSVCVVDFNKVNGERRIMTCTLDSSLLPIKEEKAEKKERKHSTVSIAAYDINKQDWRAFRVDSVNKLSTIDPNTGIETVLYSKE